MIPQRKIVVLVDATGSEDATVKIIDLSRSPSQEKKIHFSNFDSGRLFGHKNKFVVGDEGPFGGFKQFFQVNLDSEQKKQLNFEEYEIEEVHKHFTAKGILCFLEGEGKVSLVDMMTGDIVKTVDTKKPSLHSSFCFIGKYMLCANGGVIAAYDLTSVDPTQPVTKLSIPGQPTFISIIKFDKERGGLIVHYGNSIHLVHLQNWDHGSSSLLSSAPVTPNQSTSQPLVMTVKSSIEMEKSKYPGRYFRLNDGFGADHLFNTTLENLLVNWEKNKCELVPTGFSARAKYSRTKSDLRVVAIETSTQKLCICKWNPVKKQFEKEQDIIEMGNKYCEVYVEKTPKTLPSLNSSLKRMQDKTIFTDTLIVFAKY